jgi:hypothetical protein
MSATPEKRGVHPDPLQREDAAAKMAAAPIKELKDLPADHPFARRAEILSQIEDAHLKSEGVDASQFKVIEDGGDGVTSNQLEDAEIKAPPISDFTDPPKAQAKPEQKEESAKDDAAAQTTASEEHVLSVDDLKKYKVKTVIDGEEQIIDATKVLGQYQKGAAADVRLAEATKLQREAKAAYEKAQKDAQQALSHASTPSASADAQTLADNAKAAQSKFMEASEAIYDGDKDKAAKLFSEAVALAQTPASERRGEATIDNEALVSRVSQQVEQKLTEKAALDKLFTDYPEIKKHKAFGLVADEYVNAFISQGDSVADAIAKAGAAMDEEFGFIKARPQPAAPVTDKGRQLKTTAPTTIQAKADAKKELDEVPSAHARSTSTVAPEPTAQDTIAEMAKARPGARVI